MAVHVIIAKPTKQVSTQNEMKTHLPLDHALDLGILPVDQGQQTFVFGLLGLDGIPPLIPLRPQAVVLHLPPLFPVFDRCLQPLDVGRPVLHLGFQKLLMPFQFGQSSILLLNDPGIRAKLLGLLVGDNVVELARS